MSEPINLVKSDVMFNEIDHTYSYLGKSLSGVTGMLGRTLFVNKYKGISKAVLANAASYGHNIHEQIELVDSLGVESQNPAVKAYVEMKSQLGLTTLANEYLVSDEEYIASSIDLVFDDVSIADIKTTSHLDMEYVSWQLSIYAYLFEKQNPTLRVPRLFAVWLPKPQYGKPCIVEIPRKSKDAIKVLIDWDKSINPN